jgi:signal transduction histidine kinase
VILTDGLSRETAIRGIPADAYDFLPTPFENLEDVWGTVRRALEKRALSLKIRQLDRDLEIRNRELSAALKRRNSLIRAGLAMGGIGQLAAGVAHDFNNLLHGILGRTQLLGLKLGDKEMDLPSLRLQLETIEKLTLQGAETISRIQDLSRIRKDAPGGPLDPRPGVPALRRSGR